MFIAWRETHSGEVTAELKKSKRAAVMQYNKDSRRNDLKECGWTLSKDAYLHVRRAASLPIIPTQEEIQSARKYFQ